MPLIIACPSCGRRLQVPAELAEASVRCPVCGSVFESAHARSGAPGFSQEPLELALPDDGRPLPLIVGLPPPPPDLRPVLIESAEVPVDRSGLSRCSRCGQSYSAIHRRCPHCRRRGDDDDRPWERLDGPMRRDAEPHRAPLLKLLGVTSLLLGLPALCGLLLPPFAGAGLISAILGLTTWAMAARDLEKMDHRLMDVEGRPATELAKGYAQAGAILGLLGILLATVTFLALLSSRI